MHKSIIIEGPNGSGKTTLAMQLSKSLDIDMLHAGGPPSSFQESRRRCVLEELSMINKSAIRDRHQGISSVIYQDFTDYITFGFVNNAVYNNVVIYCTGEGEICFKGKKHYDDDLIEKTLKDNKIVRAKYDKMFNQFPQVIRYNFQTDDLTSLINLLKKAIQK